MTVGTRPDAGGVTAVPSLKAVRDTISGLLGKDVEVRPDAEPPTVGGDSGTVVGLYVDDGLRSAAVMVVDLPLAARLGAAIGLVPPTTAGAAADAGTLAAGLRENVTEILNVLARVLNVAGAPHVRLYSVAATAQELRPDVRALAVKAAPRVDIEVEVPRYGSGVMSVVIA